MIRAAIQNDFRCWRDVARTLLAADVPPGDVVWSRADQGGLLDGVGEIRTARDLRVPREFVKLAEAVACFDSDGKWATLYRVLYRLKHGNPNLLMVETDEDVRRARLMERAVKRDVHKFHAFVRFRLIEVDGEEVYVAWHEPQHSTVHRATPFFSRRFGTMRFSILTPKGCAHWDKQMLTFSPPAARSNAPTSDMTEEFWLTYYRSIFNPFRLKVNAMKKELPVRHWPTLPEAVLIPELIREAKGK